MTAQTQFMTPMGSSSFNMDLQSLTQSADMTGSLMLSEYQKEIARLRMQNNQLLAMKEVREHEYESMMFEN